MAPQIAESPQYPLYNVTFTTHRLSPLYHASSSLDNPTLRTHASRLRDLLVGDVLRGVRVGLSERNEVLARVGALKSVQWTILRGEEEWRPMDEETMMQDETTILEHSEKGMFIEIKYEKASYTALLLRPTKGDAEETKLGEGFTHYPLLLTRMPNTLRETILDFLSTTFDTRASPLRLTPQFLTNTLESYIANITTNTDGSPLEAPEAQQALHSILRDIVISLSFTLPSNTSTLKTIDITISRNDLTQMLSRGRKLSQFKTGTAASPFTTALAHYINGHLALDISHESVAISKIACGAFVLGDGRVKIFPVAVSSDDESQEKATWALVGSLIDLAKGVNSAGS